MDMNMDTRSVIRAALDSGNSVLRCRNWWHDLDTDESVAKEFPVLLPAAAAWMILEMRFKIGFGDGGDQVEGTDVEFEIAPGEWVDVTSELIEWADRHVGGW